MSIILSPLMRTCMITLNLCSLQTNKPNRSGAAQFARCLCMIHTLVKNVTRFTAEDAFSITTITSARRATKYQILGWQT